jgi:hypothetical protein
MLIIPPERRPLNSDIIAGRGEKFENCIISFSENQGTIDRYLVLRRVLKISGAAISAVAKVPYAPISLKLGNIVGPISVAANSSGFFILEYWAIPK